MAYKCPKDECSGVLESTDDSLECTECDHSLSEDTAVYLFEQGLLIAEGESEDVVLDTVAEEEDLFVSAGLSLTDSVDAYSDIIKEGTNLTPESLKLIYTTHIDEDVDGIDFTQLTGNFTEMLTEKEVSSELDALLESAEFDTEFKDSAKTLFEGAVKLKIKEEIDRLHDLNESFIDESIREKVEELEEKADKYLSYVAEEYMKENELAIESGMKVEAAEKILEGVQSLMAENHIEVEEDKIDAFKAMEEKVAAHESDMNTKIDENIALADEVKLLKREIIMDTISEGLTEIQTEKLNTLTEDLDFGDDIEFMDKVKVIKESFFSKTDDLQEDDNITEDVTEIDATHDDSMAAIVALLNK